MSNSMKNEIGEYAVRAGPGLSATGLTMFGYPIADIVQLVVLVYTVAQLGWFVYDRTIRRKRRGR